MTENASAVHILVVEDEPALLQLLQRFLQRQGHITEGVSSALEAIALVEQEPERFTLILTDLTLDGWTGEDLIEKLQQTQPALKGIVSSGYPYQPRSGDVGFLQKPYLPRMLQDAVNRALAR